MAQYNFYKMIAQIKIIQMISNAEFVYVLSVILLLVKIVQKQHAYIVFKNGNKKIKHVPIVGAKNNINKFQKLSNENFMN